MFFFFFWNCLAILWAVTSKDRKGCVFLRSHQKYFRCENSAKNKVKFFVLCKRKLGLSERKAQFEDFTLPEFFSPLNYFFVYLPVEDMRSLKIIRITVRNMFQIRIWRLLGLLCSFYFETRDDTKLGKCIIFYVQPFLLYRYYAKGFNIII